MRCPNVGSNRNGYASRNKVRKAKDYVLGLPKVLFFLVYFDSMYKFIRMDWNINGSNWRLNRLLSRQASRKDGAMIEEWMENYKPFLSKDDLDLMDFIVSSRPMRGTDMKSVEDFIQRNIDERYKMDTRCSTCKRYARRRVRDWKISNGIQIEKDREYYNKLKDDEEV